MNQLTQLRQSPRLVKIQPPYLQHVPQNTPKKLSQDSNVFRVDEQSTLQKTYSFFPENHVETIRKDRKKPKRPWTPEEDAILKELVQSKGAKEWAYISTFFEERCGKQCRERWHNHLRSGIKKGDWNHEEEWHLFLGVHAYGKRWSIISKYLEGRTENTLKNHWNCKMKPKKEYYSRKLDRFLQIKERNMSKTQAYLLKLIKEKPLREDEELLKESQNTQTMIRLFKGVIKKFLEAKKQIYESFEVEQQTAEVKIEEEIFEQPNFVQDELKKQNHHKQEDKKRDMKMQILELENEISDQNHTFAMMNDFGSDSNSLKMKINGVMKEVSEMDEEFDEMNDLEFEVEEDDWSESEYTKRKDGESCRSDGFGSPLRRNIFAGMDLEESTKKKVFESEKKDSEKENNQ